MWWKIRADNLRMAAGEGEQHPSKQPPAGYVRKAQDRNQAPRKF
jgi:hypothetical protein